MRLTVLKHAIVIAATMLLLQVTVWAFWHGTATVTNALLDNSGGYLLDNSSGILTQ
jgi:hypothetical protein